MVQWYHGAVTIGTVNHGTVTSGTMTIGAVTSDAMTIGAVPIVQWPVVQWTRGAVTSGAVTRLVQWPVVQWPLVQLPVVQWTWCTVTSGTMTIGAVDHWCNHQWCSDQWRSGHDVVTSGTLIGAVDHWYAVAMVHWSLVHWPLVEWPLVQWPWYIVTACSLSHGLKQTRAVIRSRVNVSISNWCRLIRPIHLLTFDPISFNLIWTLAGADSSYIWRLGLIHSRIPRPMSLDKNRNKFRAAVVNVRRWAGEEERRWRFYGMPVASNYRRPILQQQRFASVQLETGAGGATASAGEAAVAGTPVSAAAISRRAASMCTK